MAVDALPPLLAPGTRWALAGVLAALVNAALRVAVVPLFVVPVFDSVLVTQDLSALPAIFFVAAAVVAAGSLALWAQDAWMGWSAATVARRWRSGLYHRLLARPPGSLPGSSGGLSARILADLKEVEQYQRFALGPMVAESAMVIGVLVLLVREDALATTLLVALALPALLLLRLLGNRIEQQTQRMQEGLEEIGGRLQEGFRHHETVRAFGIDRFMLTRLSASNRTTERVGIRQGVWAGLQAPVAQVLVFAAVGLLVALLARRVAADLMTAGEVVAFVTLVALLATPLQLLPKGYARYRQARAAARRLYVLADSHDVYSDRATGSDAASSATGPDLRLDKVRFSYPLPEAPTLLSGVSLHWRGPTMIALTGPSGSGKTTFLKLLLRFLEPTSGSIFVSGVPLAELPEAALRRRVAYVPQGQDLLSGTIRDNLALGREVGDEQLWSALDDVGLAEAVRSLPDGLEHGLQEDGGGLSGGQRQRLAVARALLTAPEILLLDEPTANLDDASQAGVIELLRRQAGSRLVIVVAHRPEVAQAADTAFLLEASNLEQIEAGTVWERLS